jgi:hypothetical protein
MTDVRGTTVAFSLRIATLRSKMDEMQVLLRALQEEALSLCVDVAAFAEEVESDVPSECRDQFIDSLRELSTVTGQIARSLDLTPPGIKPS